MESSSSTSSTLSSSSSTFLPSTSRPFTPSSPGPYIPSTTLSTEEFELESSKIINEVQNTISGVIKNVLAAKQNETGDNTSDLDDVIQAINAAIPSDIVIKTLEVINDKELKEKIKETVGELLTEKEIESVVNLRNKEPKSDDVTTAAATTASQSTLSIDKVQQPAVLNDRVTEPQVLNDRVSENVIPIESSTENGAKKGTTERNPAKITTTAENGAKIETTSRKPAKTEDITTEPEYYDYEIDSTTDVNYDYSDYATTPAANKDILVDIKDPLVKESIIDTIIGETISNDIDDKIVVVEATVKDLPAGGQGNIEEQLDLVASQAQDEEVQNIIQVEYLLLYMHVKIFLIPVTVRYNLESEATFKSISEILSN